MRGWRVVSIPWFEWFEINEEFEFELEGGSNSIAKVEGSRLRSALRQEYLQHVLDGTLWRRHQTSANNGNKEGFKST